MVPLGCACPYSSVTAYVVPSEGIACVPGIIPPDIVTRTDLLLGGQRAPGVAVQVTEGGVCGTPLIFVIVTPPVPFSCAAESLLVVSTGPGITPPVLAL